MNYWLMKSEPDEFSIDDLKRVNCEMWDGVRNYQVRNIFRDNMKKGDMALLYHSNSGTETGVAGVMKIVREAYADPTQFDMNSKHPDAKSDPDNPRWLCVDVSYVQHLPRVVPLSEIKTDKVLQKMRVAERGCRLSVTPVRKIEFERVIKLAGK